MIIKIDDANEEDINRVRNLISFAIKENYHSQLKLLNTNLLMFYHTDIQGSVLATLCPVKTNKYYQHNKSKKYDCIENDIASLLYICHDINLYFHKDDIITKSYFCNIFNFHNKEKELKKIKQIGQLLHNIYPFNDEKQIEEIYKKTEYGASINKHYPYKDVSKIEKIYQESDGKLISYYNFYACGYIKPDDVFEPKKSMNIPCENVLDYFNDKLFTESLSKYIMSFSGLDIPSNEITEVNMPDIYLQIKSVFY